MMASGLWTSMAADEWFRHQIAYMDEKYDNLMYAIKMGPTWDVHLVDAGVNVGPFASIALSKNASLPFSPLLTPNIIYMAFNYPAGKFALKYARLQTDNVTWTGTTIDPSVGVGLFNSLVIEEDGRLHASYFDGNHGELRYATSANGSAWNFRNLTDTGDQGYFTSIDIAGMTSQLFYFDATDGESSVAYKINTWMSQQTSIPPAVSSFLADDQPWEFPISATSINQTF
jgi:hypothetical protein